MAKKLILFVSLFCLFALSVSAQEQQILKKPQKASSPPGGIRLLNGYVHVRERGIDSTVGRIAKEGGLNIRYDIGAMAGEYVNHCRRDNSCVWYKEQQLTAGVVKIALQRDGVIVATFPRTMANFYTEAKTDEDIADFLIMILTFDETQCCQNAP